MMLFCNNQFDAHQILFKKPSCWLWGILRIGLCFLLFTYNIFYMEGVVADQKLVAEIQRMMDNEQSFDLTDISGRNDSLGAIISRVYRTLHKRHLRNWKGCE